VQIISDGQKADVFKNNNAKIIAISAWSMIHGLMMLTTAGHLREVASTPEQAEQLSQTLAENLLSGILK